VKPAGKVGAVGPCAGGRRTPATADGESEQDGVDGADGRRGRLPDPCALVTPLGSRLGVFDIFQPEPEQFSRRRRRRVAFLGRSEQPIPSIQLEQVNGRSNRTADARSVA